MIYINRGVFPPTRSPLPPFLAYPQAHIHTRTSLATAHNAPFPLRASTKAKAGCYRQFALSNFSCVTYRVPDSARSLSRCNYTWSRTSAVFNVDVCRTTRRFSPILPIYYPLTLPVSFHYSRPSYVFFLFSSFETSSSHSIRPYSDLVLELFLFFLLLFFFLALHSLIFSSNGPD